MSHSFRFVRVAALLALVASACAHSKLPGAGVNAISTDLQYKQLQQKNAAPPNTVPPPAPAVLPPQPTLPPFNQVDLGPVAPPSETCPTAAPTTQAQQDVTNTVGVLPTEGEYLWRVSGRELYKGSPLPLPSYTKHQIANVKGTADSNNQSFTFETVEKELTATSVAATVRSFFSVTSQTSSDNNVKEAQSGQSVSTGRTSTAGVSLTRVERTGPSGVISFAPSQPVRYLITPVREGPDNGWTDQVVDATSDPSAPQSLTNNAFVKGRITIDACGERLRGWLVSAEQTYSQGGNSVTRHVEWGIATQMGGIIVSEHVESPCTRQQNGSCSEGKPTLQYDENLGRKES